ncbi:ASCH domain-containing protein [Serinibacter arcticus]|nr:ASCH domain-containing protein [Serinibacter arcticus]
MIPLAIANAIRDGAVTTAYRRWDVPRVKVGGTQLTASGIVRFDAVEEITDVDALTDDDARAAGVRDAVELRRRLAPPDRESATPVRRSPRGGKGGDRVYRVTLSWVGVDPRLELREKPARGAALVTLKADVAALDAGRQSGPWTRQILVWIRDNPGVISTELADLLGRELLPMKADIRRLKALGLTISLRVGYELSPRGRGYLRALERDDAASDQGVLPAP